MIRNIFESVFESNLLEALAGMCKKDACCWSRELVTAILDDSVFRQWLKSQDPTADFEECYGKFFSGQFGTTVYGFKVPTFGVCIQGVFYPLYAEYIKKATETNPNPAKQCVVAATLVDRWGMFVKKAAQTGIKIPKIHFSCDSGYNDKDLAEACARNGLVYISVPKTSHRIQFVLKGQKVEMNFSQWVEKVYLPKEKKHKSQTDGQTEPFVLRSRVFYKAFGKEVVIIAFRLNNSQRVSIVYCPQVDIFAKTLRRQWFQRTYIEQFFKLLKHVLKIQEARVKTKADFDVKLIRFTFIAYHAQQMVIEIRRKTRLFGSMGYISIQRTLNTDEFWNSLLQQNAHSI